MISIKKTLYVICILLLGVPFIIRFGSARSIIIAGTLYCLLAHLSYIDLIQKRIPNHDIVAIAVTAIFDCILSGKSITERLFVLISLSMILIVLKYKNPQIMGFGDIKLICVSSLWLGIYTITAYLIGVICAGIVFGLLLLTRKIDRKSRPAVGPYISIGIWITYLLIIK